METTSFVRCPVCYDNFSSIIRIPHCGHEFCRSCLSSYLHIKISESNVGSMTCLDCDVSLSPSFFFEFISEADQKRFSRFTERIKLSTKPGFKPCPLPDCEGYSLSSDPECAVCNQCGFWFCPVCQEQAHTGDVCPGEDKIFAEWSSAFTVKFCPDCKHRFQKEGGCLHMKCPRCSYSWCWNCGLSLEDHDEFSCRFGHNLYNVYWYVIAALILTPLLFPFSAFILVVYVVDVTSQVDPDSPVYQFLIQRKTLKYLALLFLSPALVALSLVLGGFFLGFSILKALGLYRGWLSSAIAAFLNLLLGIYFDLLILLVIVVGLVVAPLGGVALMFSRVCSFGHYKHRASVPGYPRLL